MTTRSWVRRLLARSPRRAPQGSLKASARFQPRRVRLCPEALEDRIAPTLADGSQMVQFFIIGKPALFVAFAPSGQLARFGLGAG